MSRPKTPKARPRRPAPYQDVQIRTGDAAERRWLRFLESVDPRPWPRLLCLPAGTIVSREYAAAVPPSPPPIRLRARRTADVSRGYGIPLEMLTSE